MIISVVPIVTCVSRVAVAVYVKTKPIDSKSISLGMVTMQGIKSFLLNCRFTTRSSAIANTASKVGCMYSCCNFCTLPFQIRISIVETLFMK